MTTDRSDIVDEQPAARVTVGVDGSPGSLTALDWAAREAARRGAALHIVCAWENEPGEHDSPGEHQEVAGACARSALHRVVGMHLGIDRTITETPPGPVGPALVEAARGAELFVLGTTYLGRKPGPGEVSSYCLRHAHGPIVFVPAAERHRPEPV